MRLLENFRAHHAVFLLICILTFVPRVLSLQAHWTSDEAQWLIRSRDFILAMVESDREISGTHQSYHPGVTTMWLGGIRLWLEHQSALSVLPIHMPYLQDQSALLSPLYLARTRLMIAVMTGITIIGAYFFLYRLLGVGIASIATIFIATDPFFLTQSRRLHTDALAASFLLLSFLILVFYLELNTRQRYITFSGICFGLACLSKSTSLILLLVLPSEI